MPPDIAKFLEDARFACELIREFTRGEGFADYDSNPLLRAAVEREFITVSAVLSTFACGLTMCGVH